MTDANLMETVDETTVGARFWLTFEVSSCSYRRIANRLTIDRHPGLRIKAEVTEAAYRAAYAEQFGHEASDVTLPLDDYWWNDVPVGRWSSEYSVRRCRGGHIDWPDDPDPQVGDG